VVVGADVGVGLDVVCEGCGAGLDVVGVGVGVADRVGDALGEGERLGVLT
jgi:hypothetical protein